MGYKEINPAAISDNAIKMIGDDWLLITAGDADNFNTMTASWGAMGVLWGKSVAFVFVRPQRYTFEFCERCERMTLTFFGGEKREALKVCGTKSGRDCNKVSLAGLEPMELDGLVSFEDAETVLCCRKIYTDMIKPENMLDSTIMANYKNNDFHKVYILEIEKVFVRE